MARGASRTPSKNTGTGLPGWFKGALCIAIGFGIAHYFFSGKDNTAPRAPTRPLSSNSAPATPSSNTANVGGETAHPADTNEASSATQRQQVQKNSDEQSFDFYTILPSSEITPSVSSSGTSHLASATLPTQARPVTVLTSSEAPSAPVTAAAQPRATSAPTLAAPSSDRYILQSLSTASQESANALAAQLRDLGIPTQVHSAQLANGKTTYRVQSGPFAEGAERDRALGLIRVQHLNPIVMRVH